MANAQNGRESPRWRRDGGQGAGMVQKVPIFTLERGISMNMNEKDNSFSQDQTNTKETVITGTKTMENSTSTDQTSDNKEGVHTSELSPTVQEYIDYPNDIGTLIAEMETVNQRLDTMTNIFIVGMIGIGLVVGILACNIFARYFIS